MALQPGTQAPDFVLKSKSATGLDDIRLSDQFGKKPVVLLFFPFAFTGVCTAEMCTIRDTLNVYGSLGATVYGISVDSPFAQEAMAQKEGLNFPLLSDFNKEVSSAYGVLYEDFIGFKGVSNRAVFVIGKDGKIVFSSYSDDPKVVPDFDQVQAALKSLG